MCSKFMFYESVLFDGNHKKDFIKSKEKQKK